MLCLDLCTTCMTGTRPCCWINEVHGTEKHAVFSCGHLPCCLFGAAAFCACCAYPSSLKHPEDKNERAPLRREAGKKNRGSRGRGEDERQECWLDGEGGRRVICPGENNRADSTSFSPRIYGSMLSRGGLKSTVINHQGGQMRCSIQSFPQLQIKALRMLQNHQGQSSKCTLLRRGCGHKNSYFWRIHSVFHCLEPAFVSHRARPALISIRICLHQMYPDLTMVYLNKWFTLILCFSLTN